MFEKKCTSFREKQNKRVFGNLRTVFELHNFGYLTTKLLSQYLVLSKVSLNIKKNVPQRATVFKKLASRFQEINSILSNIIMMDELSLFS